MGRQLEMEEKANKSLLTAQLGNDLLFNKDLEKAYSGNRSASVRLRKLLKQIENSAKDARKEILQLRDTCGQKCCKLRNGKCITKGCEHR